MKTRDEWKKILRHLLENKDSPQKVTQVKVATKIHPERLAIHKTEMEKKD